MKGIVRLSQGVLGITLAIAVMFFVCLTVTRYFITRLSVLPPRPTFPNDNPAPPTASPAGEAPVAVASPEAPPVEASPAAIASPEASPSPESSSEYVARVTVPVGLILRDGPSRSAGQIGGVEYNAEVTVLETSPDGEWISVRLPSGETGWVKSGNLAPIE